MADHFTSSWDKASVIASLIQAVAVIVSLIFIAYQVRKQTKLSRAANMQALAGLISPLNLKLAEDRKLATLWLKGPPVPDVEFEVTEELLDEFQYTKLFATYLIFYENVFTQYQMGLLDEDVYDAWDKDLQAFLESFETETLEKDWKERRDAYRSAFHQHIDDKINLLPRSPEIAPASPEGEAAAP
jgi:hypothetical protein